MEVSDVDIKNLRTAFFQKISDEGVSETETFHSADINRINANGDWLRRFLVHNENDQKEALKMLWDTCEWRNKFGVNGINEKTVDMSVINEGSLFAHGRDKDGKALLIFKSKKHVKGHHDAVDMQKVLIYWMERLEREQAGEMISVFFDMDGAGISNMDMDYTKYLIGLFKNYYPNFLNNILIFEMAWVLNAGFKIIKSWLPPKAVQKIKFLSKKDLNNYIDPDQALKSWGGRNEYEFVFVPEVKQPAGDGERKKVHFADRSPTSDSVDFMSPSPSITSSHKLSIVPHDVLSFASDGAELTGSLCLRNDDSTTIAYKIKTTSPEKFRVRPSAGILQQGGAVTVAVVLQPGYDVAGLARDKFLIMTVPVNVPDPSAVDLTELWKAAGSDVIQHRVRCSLPQALVPESIRNGTVQEGDRQFTKLSSEISKLHNQLHSVGEEVRRIQIQQWVLIILVGLLAGLNLYLSRDNKESHDDVQACFSNPPPQQP